MKPTDSLYRFPSSRDRRHAPRRKVDSVVYLTLKPNNGGVLLNLSEGGMCISVANPLANSSQIHFSIALGEDQPIEGTGQVTWLSESGRSAGVQFLSFPDAYRARIREWLDDPGASAKRVNPKRAIPVEKPAPPDQASAQAAAVTAETQRSHEEDRPAPQMPLLFLPRKQEPEEISSEDLFTQEQPYVWHEGNSRDNDGETVVAYRSAIGSTAEPDEDEVEEDHRSNKILIVGTVCFALLALGVAGVVEYPNRFFQLRQFAISLTAPRAVASDTSVEAPTPRRARRREARPRVRVPSGPLRGSHPVRDIATFEAPSQSGAGLATEMPDPSRQRWLATASGRKLAPDDERSSTPSAARAQASLPPENAGPAATAEPPNQPPALIANSRPTPTARVGNLRVDGGRLEEGSVTPTYAPLNLNGQSLSSKPIVVEAVIGRDGRVKHVRLVSSPSSSLAEAIVEAVKLWRYRPLYQNGEPIEFKTRITVDFEGSTSKH